MTAGWDAATGKLVAGPLIAGEHEILNLQFNPNGRLQLLAATESNRITLWNLDDPIADAASFEDLRTAAEILANRRIDSETGKVLVLTRDELQSRWENMTPTVRALVTRQPPGSL